MHQESNTGCQTISQAFILCIGISCLFPFSVSAAEDAPSVPIRCIWLSHRSHQPDKIVVNWYTEDPGDSVVRFGTTSDYGESRRIEEQTQLHHVEIPIPERDVVYHYSVSTGERHSADAVFKGYPRDVLRVAIAADWQRKPDISAILNDDPHLLLTAGDQIVNLRHACGNNQKECVKPYVDLIETYPRLFRSVPFLPVLGNHDREIRPRGPRPPSEPVYDVDATAFRRFFDLPGDEWKWRFDVPDFQARFVGLDFNHISDFGTTWQTCHPFGENSEQFKWYAQVMQSAPRFTVTLFNEKSSSIRRQADGRWHELFSRGTFCVTGFGYFAERAEVDGFPYYNTSLSGTGDRYPDPQSQFLASENNYVLLTFDRQQETLIVELKNLDGHVLDQQVY